MENWTSVEDGLPEKKKKIQLFCKPIGITVGYYWGEGHDKVPSDPCKGWSIMGVTHWCLLPEPPEGFKDIFEKG